MGLWKRLFGKTDAPRSSPRAATAARREEDLDPAALVEELRAEGSKARAGEIDVNAAPKQVCRYIFVRLMHGTPPAQLRTDLVQRGFTSKVADAYIQLIQQVMFRG